MRPRTKAERETIIRWDDEGTQADLYTTSPTQARFWRRWGIALTERSGGWCAQIPKDRVARRKFVLTHRKANRWSFSTARAGDSRHVSESRQSDTGMGPCA